MTKGNQKQPTAGANRQQTAAEHLFEFEKVPFSKGTNKPKTTDEELNSRYAKGGFRIVTEQARYPLAGILGMLQEEIENDDGKNFTYEVLPIGNQRAWRYSDPFRLKLRIHTKLITTEES